MVEKFKDSTKSKLDNNPFESGGLMPDPQNLIHEDDVKLDVLKQLVGKSVVSVQQFHKELVVELCKFAALLEMQDVSESAPLYGRIVITAFFEPSTRTRLSFESSVQRLQGRLLSIPLGQVTGTAKGESLADIGEMFNAYGDIVVMRHTKTEAIDEMLSTLRIPMINAGNGSGEHPTQALSDWFAILKWKPKLKLDNVPEKDKVHLGILGTPGSMRAVNSFLRMSVLFKEGIRKISLVSELADPLGEELTDLLSNSGIEYEITNDINDVLSELDVIYMNSIAFLGDGYKSLDSRYKLNKDSNIKKDAVILHPLARLDELDTTLDSTKHNLYFTQAHGAVFMREALFIAMLDRFYKLNSKEVTQRIK